MGAKNNNYRTGKVCYTNGTICKYLLPEQIEEYTSLGWYKGTLRKPLTKEQRDNISRGTIKAMDNKIVRDKLSKAAKRNVNKERFLQNRRKNWTTQTPHEKYINDFMVSLGFEYELPINMKEYKLNNPELKLATHYKPDFANKDLKIAIELDGKSHTYKEKETDKKKEKALEYYGYITYRFKNEEVYNKEFKTIILDIIAKRKLVMIDNE